MYDRRFESMFICGCKTTNLWFCLVVVKNIVHFFVCKLPTLLTTTIQRLHCLILILFLFDTILGRLGVSVSTRRLCNINSKIFRKLILVNVNTHYNRWFANARNKCRVSNKNTKLFFNLFGEKLKHFFILDKNDEKFKDKKTKCIGNFFLSQIDSDFCRNDIGKKDGVTRVWAFASIFLW